MKCIIFCPSEKRGQVRWTSPVDKQRQRNQRKMHEKLPRLTLTDNKQFRLSVCLHKFSLISFDLRQNLKVERGKWQKKEKEKLLLTRFPLSCFCFTISLLLFASICCNDFPHQQRHKAEERDIYKPRKRERRAQLKPLWANIVCEYWRCHLLRS